MLMNFGCFGSAWLSDLDVRSLYRDIICEQLTGEWIWQRLSGPLLISPFATGCPDRVVSFV